MLGREFVEVHPLLARVARQRGVARHELDAAAAKAGVVTRRRPRPDPVDPVFVTALELPPSAHLRMQAAVQRHVDAAVAKTINLSADATVEEVRRIYLAAWRANVKGITVYRDRSRPQQVLRRLEEPSSGTGASVEVDGAYAGGCPHRACEL